jgi:hypothetical protein
LWAHERLHGKYRVIVKHRPTYFFFPIIWDWGKATKGFVQHATCFNDRAGIAHNAGDLESLDNWLLGNGEEGGGDVKAYEELV